MRAPYWSLIQHADWEYRIEGAGGEVVEFKGGRLQPFDELEALLRALNDAYAIRALAHADRTA